MQASGSRVIGLCFLVAIIEGFDLQAAGVAAPLLAPAFGLGPAQMGVFFAMATLGLIVGALLGGRIADRWGRKAGLVLALATFGVFSIATAFTWDLTSLCVARCLTGIGLGAALPNIIAIAAESVPAKRTSTAVAVMYAGFPIGGALAALTSVLNLHGGWTTVFLVGGVAPVVVAPLLIWLLPTMTSDKSLEPGAPSEPLKALFGPSQALPTLALWLAFFFSLLVLYLLLNWLPALLIERGADRTAAGGVQIAFNLAGAVTSLFIGRAMDRFSRKLVVTVTFGALIVALLSLSLVSSLTMVLISAVLIGGAVLGVQAILYGLAPAQYPSAVRGTGVGAAVAVGRLGSIAGPLLAGMLVAAGATGGSVFLSIVPIAALGGAATLWLICSRALPSPIDKNS